MKTFITGATGFIGTQVARRLAQSEHELHCLVRKTSNVHQLEELGATLIRGDVTDRESLREGMKGCDWVINVAGLYSFWEPNKRAYTEVNVEGTRNVMECALEAGVSKVVHISTAGIWGIAAVLPFTEDTLVGPDRFCAYFETKYQGDLIVWELYENRGLPLVMIYPGAVVGPGDPKPTGQYVRDFINRKFPATMFNDSVLTYVHVNDVAEAIVKVAEKEGNIGEKYLVGKEQLSFRQINQMLSEVSGVPVPRMTLPGPVVMVNAALLTLIANVVKKPPMWNLSMDLARILKAGKEGWRFDGSKAERELGITYTPVRTALDEEVASYRV